MQRLSANEWTPSHAAHLLSRAGFGGAPAHIQQLHSLGHEGAVDYLISGLTAKPSNPLPESIQPDNRREMGQSMRDLPEEEKRVFIRDQRRKANRETQQLRRWFLDNMRETDTPLKEKLCLFWHGHFATSIRKVREPYLMLQQIDTLREHGHETFADLVKRISKDPAMLVWLDGANSRKGKPNENFARELMELFTLGEGNYTETDIQEAARAFTGYRVEPATRKFRLVWRQQDLDPKKIFGLTQNYSGDMVIDAIAGKEQCQEFLAAKLWSFFASDSQANRPVVELADVIRSEKFVISGILRRLFSSNAFYDHQVMANQIKSPVQWLIQLTRAFDIPIPDDRRSAVQFHQLGQVLLDPPNVRGWIGGRAWITQSSLVARQNLAKTILTRALKPEKCMAWIEGIEPDSLETVNRITSRVFCRPTTREFNEKLLPGFLALREEDPDSAPMKFAIHLTSLPEYQLT